MTINRFRIDLGIVIFLPLQMYNFSKKIDKTTMTQIDFFTIKNRQFSIKEQYEIIKRSDSTLFTGDRVNVIIRQSLFAYCPSWSLTTTIQFR